MELIERYKANKKAKDLINTKRLAYDLFQIAEYNEQLWLTFNGSMVCPCDMLKDEPVESVNKMRDLYIKRNTK